MAKKLIWATLLLTAGAACNADELRSFDRTVPADARGVVEISNVSGRIEVIGWDRNEVAVHAQLEENVERVDVTTSKGRTVVKVVLPNMSSHGDGDADVEVRVPSQSEVQVTAVSADVETSGLKGAQRLKTVSGELRADLSGANFEAKSVSGDLRLRGSGQPADMRVATVSGDVVLDRGGGDVDATSVSGNVHLEMAVARDVRLHSTSGDLVLRGTLHSDARVEAETVSGDVTLRSRAAAGGLEYEVSSFSGDIENCFGKEAERVSEHGPGTRLEGSTGDGKARLRVKSMSGDVDICDR